MLLSSPDRNGAGKSTASTALLRDMLGIRHFVNADTLARGLSAFAPEDWALKAGKIMLEHLHELAAQRVDFAFETTLASRTFAQWIGGLKQQGFLFHLIYLWLPLPELAVQRVRDRVRDGGHDVPKETVLRRHRRGLQNFFRLYRPLADSWQLFDNSDLHQSRLVAERRDTMDRVVDPHSWVQIQWEIER